MAKQKKLNLPTFEDQLVLFKYYLNKLKLDSLDDLSENLNSPNSEGLNNDSGNTFFCEYLVHICQKNNSTIKPEELRQYDENICRYTRQIGKKRGGITWKYFQYISLLFTEMYLDHYFSDIDAFCDDLNVWLQEIIDKSNVKIDFSPYTAEKLNKLAFMCATGSGKTLIMHMNILQFRHYFKRAQRQNYRLTFNNIILLAPNEGMSKQHLEELSLSSIPASIFEKGPSLFRQQNDVIVIDINKLKDEDGVKTVSVDNFEQNNLVLVDEGHRGLSGEVWYDYRTRLSENGFAFEYSATFKQAINANAKDKKEEEGKRALMEEYGKSIIMDYSYKYFYTDGYGKDYRIYNLQGNVSPEQKSLYLIGCLLSFYQQMKLYEEKTDELRKFHIEKPLLVFVGNRVTAPTKTEKEQLLTDVEEVLVFLNNFLSNREQSIEHIRAVLKDDTGLIDGSGRELFYNDFPVLQEFFGIDPDPSLIFTDILRIVFNTNENTDEPRLRMETLPKITGEIGLKVGEYGDYFGVINIGDTSGLIKKCEQKGIIVSKKEFISESLFRNINTPNSNIKMLIGSRKFTEGWNSWRVSTMGLINFAKGEGAQAIQLFGRGVRLKGYEGCLKRSSKLGPGITPPAHIKLLETLTIFGVQAQYMEYFKNYLEKEGVSINDNVHEYHLPVISRYEEVKNKKLHIIKVKDGANFKQQAARLILNKPDLNKPSPNFWNYLIKNKTIIDCRSKIQTIESTDNIRSESDPEPLTIPTDYLPLLDLQRIFEELQEYKCEKKYFNIIIVKENLLDILQMIGWYGLQIPQNHLVINSIAKLETVTDYAIMALKSYMDKFFKFEKDQWETQRLEYAVLDSNDSNFIDDYTLTYEPHNSDDSNINSLETFVEEMSTILQANNGLDAFMKESFTNGPVLYDFKSHLYAPLIYLKKSDLKIQVSPIELNHDEIKFVEYLKTYVEKHSDDLADKSLYLLRNKSKVGIGFFEAGNFYQDFILWIDTPETQYISFIDPKGLRFVRPDDPKIEFYKTIKEKEALLSPTATEKRIVLNSFIMSGTNSSDLDIWWSNNSTYREARNVYTLDNEQCVELMISKILQEQ